MNFEFTTAARIIFGPGKLKELGSLVKGRILLVQPKPALPVKVSLPECVPFSVTGEPTVQLVRDGMALARQERCDVVSASAVAA